MHDATLKALKEFVQWQLGPPIITREGIRCIQPGGEVWVALLPEDHENDRVFGRKLRQKSRLRAWLAQRECQQTVVLADGVPQAVMVMCNADDDVSTFGAGPFAIAIAFSPVFPIDCTAVLLYMYMWQRALVGMATEHCCYTCA